MKKLLVLFCMIAGLSVTLHAQEPVEGELILVPAGGDSVYYEEAALVDSIPVFNLSDVAMFSTDTLPTPQYMTMLLVEEGVITPEQIQQAHEINKNYDRKIKVLTNNPRVSKDELDKAAKEQDDAYKAVLSDDQQQAYEGVRPRFQQQNWRYNWMMNNCGSLNGWNCDEYENAPEWMPGPGERPGWMRR